MVKWLCKKSISLFYGYLTEQTKVYYVSLIVLFCKKKKLIMLLTIQAL